MDGTQTSGPESSAKKPGLAAALSALIPGSGQWYAGRLRRGLVVASPMVRTANQAA